MPFPPFSLPYSLISSLFSSHLGSLVDEALLVSLMIVHRDKECSTFLVFVFITLSQFRLIFSITVSEASIEAHISDLNCTDSLTVMV